MSRFRFLSFFPFFFLRFLVVQNEAFGLKYFMSIYFLRRDDEAKVNSSSYIIVIHV